MTKNKNKLTPWKISNNTDATDIENKCLGLSVRRTDAPVGSDIYRDRGLQIQIRHNRNPLTFDLANDLTCLISAAPEMMETLERIKTWLNDMKILGVRGTYLEEVDTEIRNIQKVIDKAKGK